MRFLSLLRSARSGLSKAAALSSPYFLGPRKAYALGLLGASVALTLALVWLSVLFNDWNRVFYDALQNKDSASFWRQLGIFCALAAGFILLAGHKLYITQRLALDWREHLTRDLISRWSASGRLALLELEGSENIDQRISEDASAFASETLSLGLGLLDALVTLVSFVGILWALSGPLAVASPWGDLNVPGFMVWMALLYSVAGTWIGHLIGRPLRDLGFASQRAEADLRRSMLLARERAASISALGGEPQAGALHLSRFEAAKDVLLNLLRVRKAYAFFSSGHSQAAVVFPFLVAAPRFFSGAIQLGQMMQIASAFGQVQGSLSWVVASYTSWAGWLATLDRLWQLETRLRGLEARGPLAPASDPSLDRIQIGPLRALDPQGRLLLEIADPLTLPPGSVTLLSAPSGAGKSTLLRALRGLWPHVEGALPALPSSLMSLPQRPYIPEGSLRAALCFPLSETALDDPPLRQALVDAGLASLALDLDARADWMSRLSGGEQQKLSAARALAHRPRWILADEPFSALDTASARDLLIQLSSMTRLQAGGLLLCAHDSFDPQLHSALVVAQAIPTGGFRLLSAGASPR